MWNFFFSNTILYGYILAKLLLDMLEDVQVPLRDEVMQAIGILLKGHAGRNREARFESSWGIKYD